MGIGRIEGAAWDELAQQADVRTGIGDQVASVNMTGSTPPAGPIEGFTGDNADLRAKTEQSLSKTIGNLLGLKPGELADANPDSAPDQEA